FQRPIFSADLLQQRFDQFSVGGSAQNVHRRLLIGRKSKNEMATLARQHMRYRSRISDERFWIWDLCVGALPNLLGITFAIRIFRHSQCCAGGRSLFRNRRGPGWTDTAWRRSLSA